MEVTATSKTETLSGSRWMAVAMVVLVPLQLQLVTFAPAAVASPIISSLQLSRTQFGLIISTLNITIAICQVLGSVLVDRTGLKRALFSGVAVVGIGAAVLPAVHSLRFLIFARVVQGVGIAITYPALGALIMAWFSKREQPYINTLFAALAFLGIGVGMLVTTELFRYFRGSWRLALGAYGVSILATSLAWLAFGRGNREVVSVEKTAAAGATAKAPSSLLRALAMPVAWTMATGIFAISWVYNMYFTFIPLFLESARGISLSNANRLASLLPFSGVAGVIVFGLLATRAAWRKHLLWTSCGVVILGSIALFFGEGAVTKAGLLVAGFGLSGFLPVANTYMMSLPSMTPSLVAAFAVLMNVALYLAGFISPLAVGWVSQSSFGLRNTLALFSWFELVAIIAFMRLPTITSVDVCDAERTSAQLHR